MLVATCTVNSMLGILVSTIVLPVSLLLGPFSSPLAPTRSVPVSEQVVLSSCNGSKSLRPAQVVLQIRRAGAKTWSKVPGTSVSVRRGCNGLPKATMVTFIFSVTKSGTFSVRQKSPSGYLSLGTLSVGTTQNTDISTTTTTSPAQVPTTRRKNPGALIDCLSRGGHEQSYQQLYG
jgi:hypothetical protein